MSILYLPKLFSRRGQTLSSPRGGAIIRSGRGTPIRLFPRFTIVIAIDAPPPPIILRQ